LLNKNLMIKLPKQVPNPRDLGVKIRLDSISNGIFSLIFGKKADSAEKVPSAEVLRLARLLSRGLRFDSLQGLLNMSQLNAGVGDETRQLLTFALREGWFKGFDYRDIERSLRASGLFHEQAVRDGRVQPNLKEVLLRILQNSRIDRSDLFALASAIEDLESSQLESLAQQLNRITQYQWLLPVLSDWPIELQLFGGDPQEEEDNSDTGFSWKVVIKVRVNESETIDLSAVFSAQEIVSLYFSMPNQELLELANSRKDWLSNQLEKQGIRVDELRIFRKDEVRPTDKYSQENHVEGEKRLIADA